MNKSLRSFPSQSRCVHRIAKQEQGLALMSSLMMGMVLFAGASGLLARQLMTRKLGALESYQQMAETAALNGFNRILGTLNNNNPNNYRGYLLTLDNIDPDSGDVWPWEALGSADASAPKLEELCTDTSNRVPESQAADWPRTGSGVQITEGTSQRNDGKAPIQLFYRLRGYSSPGKGGIGEGIFEVEGIVKRDNQTTDSYLARTLLRRSLYVQSIVPAEKDWAVMGGNYMELAGSRITDHTGAEGPGLILLDVTDASGFDTVNCNILKRKDLVNAESNELSDKIWPTLNRGLPLGSLFIQDNAFDEDNNGLPRIWSFDDSERIAIDESIDESGSTAEGESTDNTESGGDSTSNTLSSANLSFHAQCPDEGIVCVRSQDSTTFSQPEGVTIADNEITLHAEDICTQQSSFECHLYVEHLDLSKTKLLIENGDRPVVLHLEKPVNDTINPNLSGAIHLRNGSLLCGVNNGSSSCNQQPEKLIISASAGTSDMNCSYDRPHMLRWEGSSKNSSTLPHAIVHLPRGTVKPFSDAYLHGVIWAHSICANDGDIQLVTENNGETVIQASDSLWKWTEKGFPGYGRMVARGIRGTGFDIFRRW